MKDLTLKERLKNIADDWGGKKKEVRQTTIGWQLDESYEEVEGKTPSGEPEFSKVVRPTKKDTK
jgi:hypothetical protein